MFIFLHVPLRAQTFSEGSVLDDSLFNHYLSIVEKAIDNQNFINSNAYILVDAVSHDTVINQLHLFEAIKYLENFTGIYMPRAKMGDGMILSQKIIQQWELYYKTRFATKSK